MSLILDALRKVERERDNPEQVVVVGTIPWQGVRRSRRWRWLAVLAAIGLVGAGARWWWIAAARVPAAAPPARPAPASPASPAPSVAPARTASFPTPGPSTMPAPSEAAPPTDAARPARTSRTVRATAAANPTTPGEATATAAPPADPTVDLRLLAISSRDGRPVAVINGRVVHEGDRFDDVRVVRIGEAEVEVQVRGRRRVLRF